MSRSLMGFVILAGIGYGGYWLGRRSCARGR